MMLMGGCGLLFFEMLKKTSKMLIFFAAFLFSLRFVALPDRLFSTLSHAWFLVVAIQMAIWLDQAYSHGCVIYCMPQAPIKTR